jgi:hypothetical protein
MLNRSRVWNLWSDALRTDAGMGGTHTTTYPVLSPARAR